MKRRDCLLLLAAAPLAWPRQTKVDPNAPADWVCPMDPDYRSTKPGICPRCGMKLIAGVPDRLEYPLEVTQAPELLRPGDNVTLTFRAIDPVNRRPVTHFEIVHEKLMHLFLVSEDLEFFAHVHPVLQNDGSFQLQVCLPNPGMYRLLADYYPAGGVPQLSVDTLYVTGKEPAAHLQSAVAPFKAQNMTAALRVEPEAAIAGLETKLFYTLDPADGLETYLGAWAHMLAASEDLIDLLHLHPFLASGGATAQFNIIFPRPALYRIWTQFQRRGVVNTIVFTLPVKAL